MITLILTLTLLFGPAAAVAQQADPAAPDAPAAATAAEAERRVRAAIQLNPDQGSYHLELAELLRAQGRQPEADQALRRAIELGAVGAVPADAASERGPPPHTVGGPPAAVADRPGGRPRFAPAVVAALTAAAAVVLGLAGVAVLIPLAAGVLALLVIMPVQALGTAWRRRERRTLEPQPGPVLSGPAKRSPPRPKAGSKGRGAGGGRRRRGPR